MAIFLPKCRVLSHGGDKLSDVECGLGFGTWIVVCCWVEKLYRTGPSGRRWDEWPGGLAEEWQTQTWPLYWGCPGEAQWQLADTKFTAALVKEQGAWELGLSAQCLPQEVKELQFKTGTLGLWHFLENTSPSSSFCLRPTFFTFFCPSSFLFLSFSSFFSLFLSFCFPFPSFFFQQREKTKKPSLHALSL